MQSYLQNKRKYIELKGGSLKYGRDLEGPSDPIVLQYLAKYGLVGVDPAMNVVIVLGGAEYENIFAIPEDVFMTHQDLQEYRIKFLADERNIRAFILYRLVEKYNYNDPTIRIASEDQIDTLYTNSEFLTLFIDYLTKYINLEPIVAIENEIINASRPNVEVNQWGYRRRTGDPTIDRNLRTRNTTFLKPLRKGTDDAWALLVAKAGEVLGYEA